MGTHHHRTYVEDGMQSTVGCGCDLGYNHVSPPTDRGDATQPDPAVIDIPTNEGVIRDETAWYDAIRQCVTNFTVLSPSGHWVLTTRTRGEFAVALLEAAAAVIVPATAEQIAAAQEALAEQHRPSTLPPPHTAEDHAWYAGVRDAARLARRRFAAGLSAGATDEKGGE